MNLLRHWLGLMALLILLSGCQTQRYNHVVSPILESGFVNPKSNAISLQLLDYKTGQPINGATVFVLSKTQPMQLVTDSNGWFHLPISEAWRRENPRMTNNYPERSVVRASATVTITPNTGTP